MKFLCRLFGHDYYVVQELAPPRCDVATTTSTGSLTVNAAKLVKTPEAQRQIKAMRTIARLERIIKPWR